MVVYYQRIRIKKMKYIFSNFEELEKNDIDSGKLLPMVLVSILTGDFGKELNRCSHNGQFIRNRLSSDI